MRWFLLVLGVAVLAACGGDDSATTTTAGATTSTAARPATTAIQSQPSTLPPTTMAASQPTTTVPATTASAGNGEFATFGTRPPNRNWLQASTRTGASIEEEPELCVIVSNGETGHIRSQNFDLAWSDGQWTLGWNFVGGTYSGPVEGMVDDITVTFEGDANGVAVRGSVVCYEA